jgi:hypothetical protein
VFKVLGMAAKIPSCTKNVQGMKNKNPKKKRESKFKIAK